MTRLSLLAVLVAVSLLGFSSVHAADTGQGNAARGKTLIYTCAGCHGIPGYENAYPNYRVPKIAGQNKQYILDALHGYRSGTRKHPTMDAQASSLSEQDMQDIATYLSSLATKPAKLGPKVGLKKATTCFACHGKDGQAVAANYPRLAGQYQNYMEQALHEYQSGQRNNAIMKGFASQLSDQDIKEITAYFHSLPSELSTLKYHIQGANEMGASN
ncbi:cytochrome c [Oleiagrimonas sp.]|uniref:c-type cytochrome n=1 Tax=Oleiagrimonas sp. TaxID=2010330 RepID=UPI00261CE4D1|nr:cytochrome c [Oleiagrimonas sp.]MDA3914191.1 cytochrome c [Oleiagrimonas sp.]